MLSGELSPLSLVSDNGDLQISGVRSGTNPAANSNCPVGFKEKGETKETSPSAARMSN
jgi:hypothetical protein